MPAAGSGLTGHPNGCIVPLMKALVLLVAITFLQILAAGAALGWVYITRDFSDNPVLSLIGHYHDVIVRTGEGWRFQRREAYLDFPFQVQDFSA